MHLREAQQKFAAGAVLSVQHPALTGGIRYQQPLEIGTPTSIFANLATIYALNTNITKTSNAGGGGAETETDRVFQ